MQRIQVYLEDATAKVLTKFASKNDLSLSHAAADILKNHFQFEAGKSNVTMDYETKAYFLRIINTLNQVLICTYDPKKSTTKSKSAAECIAKIKNEIQGCTEKKNQIAKK